MCFRHLYLMCISRRWNADEHVMQDVELQDVARREVSQQKLLLDTMKLLSSKVEVATLSKLALCIFRSVVFAYSKHVATMAESVVGSDCWS